MNLRRRAFFAALAVGFIHSQERDWVEWWRKVGQKFPVIYPSPTPPLLEIGDLITFGDDPTEYFVIKPGDPATALGAEFVLAHPAFIPV